MMLLFPAAMGMAMQGNSFPSRTITSSIGERRLGVIVLINAFGPGGVERIALRLAQGWRDAGVDVRLVVGQDCGRMRDGQGISYTTAAAWPVVEYGLGTLRLVAEVRRAVRARRPDILFCPGNTYSLAAVLLRLILWRDCPPIVAKISNDLVRRDLPMPLRLAYRLWTLVQGRLIHRFAALSAPMAAEARARLGVSAERVTVMPNPVLALADMAEIPLPRAPDGGRRFVAVGRLERQKDFRLMLHAFARERGPGDTLSIIGEGRERHALERLTSELGIADQVRFAGFSGDVPAVLRAHDVLLLSSRFEGLPGVVVEALAGGLAIVATQCSASMASLLDKGALGTVVPVGDLDAFAAAIATVRPDAQDVARARKKAQAFTIEAAVPAYLAWFGEIAAARQSHAAPPARMIAQTA